MPRHLVLIRHSQSAPDPGVPVHRWTLTDERRRRCQALASRLAVFSPALVASSPEPKALETATLTMGHLGRDAHAVEIVDGLREHSRETMPWLAQEDFDAKLKEFFARPDVLVIGEETASQALLRFTRAVTKIMRAAELKFGPTDERTGLPTQAPPGDIFVFTHATVMTLFVAACTGQDAFAFWRTLGMPSFVVLTLPELIVEETVADVDR